MEGGQYFVKNRVGGKGVNLNLDNVFKYIVCFFNATPNKTSSSTLAPSAITGFSVNKRILSQGVYMNKLPDLAF